MGAPDHGVLDGPATGEFRFRVEDVPSGSAIYSVEVTHRGEVSFTEENDADNLSLTLG